MNGIRDIKAILLLVVLISCSKSNGRYEISIIFLDGEGLKTGTLIKSDSSVIGEITELHFNDLLEVVATAKINNEIVIPSGTIFIHTDGGLFEESIVYTEMTGAKIDTFVTKFNGYTLTRNPFIENDELTHLNDSLINVFLSDSVLYNHFPKIDSLLRNR